MPVCAVITCKYATEGHDDDAEGIEFHPFPKCKETKARWLEMTGQGIWDPENTPNFVCSRHFRESDYIVKRSGRKYLKTSAIPCEYVVYPLSIFHDEESDEENFKPPPPAQEAVRDEPEPGFLSDAEPGPIQGLPRPPVSQEPDSTFIDENAICEPWEQFFPGYFSKETSSEVGSSSECDFRDVGSAINPYPPVDLGPHLQQLPLPRTPEPFMLEEETQDSIAAVPPEIAYEQSKAKLDDIRKIISKRKSSKKND